MEISTFLWEDPSNNHPGSLANGETSYKHIIYVYIIYIHIQTTAVSSTCKLLLFYVYTTWTHVHVLPCALLVPCSTKLRGRQHTPSFGFTLHTEHLAFCHDKQTTEPGKNVTLNMERATSPSANAPLQAHQEILVHGCQRI